MIKLQDSGLIEYFNSLQKGTILSNDDVTKHQSLFSINFDGVTGEQDLQSFKVVKQGELLNNVGIMGSPIQLQPVFPEKMTEATRNMEHWDFMEPLEQTTFNRVKTKMMVQSIQTNGGSSIANTDFWNSTVSIKKGDSTISKLINDFTLEDLKGTDLFNEVHTETLLGRNTNLTYESATRRHIVENRLQVNTAEPAVKRTSIPANKATTAEEIVQPQPKVLGKDFSRWPRTAVTMVEDTDNLDILMRGLTIEDIGTIERLKPSEMLDQYNDVKKYLELNINVELRAEVDKRLGVGDASLSKEERKALRDAKKELFDELSEKEMDKRLAQDAKDFQKNALMYLVDARDYLDPSTRGATPEEMTTDIYKAQSAERKAQERDERYLERLRAATHTQDENGNWVQNTELPGKQSDKLAQSIMIDANPTSSSEGAAASIIRTIEAGQESYRNAVNDIEPARQQLKIMSTEYGELFKQQKSNEISDEVVKQEMKSLIGRLLNGDETLTKEESMLAADYRQVSMEIDEITDDIENTKSKDRKSKLEAERTTLEMHRIYVTDGVAEKIRADNDKALGQLGENIKRQSAAIRKLEETIRNNGYSTEFGKTVYDPETNGVKHIGISREMYDQYKDNPERQKKLLENEAEQKVLYTQRKRADNVTSWYNAMEKGTIVKGSFSDDMGYKISHISDENMVYMQRPALKVSDLTYSLDISNKDLVANIGNVEDELMAMFNPTQKAAIDTNLMLSNFEDVERGHVTLFAEIPEIKLQETAMTAGEIQRAKIDISRAIKAKGEVKRTSLPNWAIERIEQTALDLHKERKILQESSDFEKEEVKKLTEEIAAGKNDASKLASLEERREAARIAQLKLSDYKNIEAKVFGGITDSIMDEMAKKKFSRASFQNDKIEAEMKEFGFTRSTETGRASISRDDFTKILLGTDEYTTPFYKQMLSSHFGHLLGAKGDGSNAVADGIQNVIDEHIVLGSDLDLTDEAMIRTYMNGVNSKALGAEGLTDEQRQKVEAYTKSLGDKGIRERLQDRLFPEVIRSGMNQAHDDGGLTNIVRAIYKNQSQQMPEADITGQSMYAYIHNPDNAVNARIKQTYQKQILNLSVDELTNVLDEYKSVGNVTTASLDATYEGSDKPIYQMGVYDEYDFDEPSSKKGDGSTFAEMMKTYSGKDIDIRDLEKTSLDGEWDKLIENNPQMSTVHKMIKKAGRQLERSVDPEDKSKYSSQLGRLNLYALGIANDKEEEFKKALNLSELAKIYPDESLMSAALKDPSNLNDRQIASVLTLANETGQRVEVSIPIGEGQRASGYLQFNDKNEIEVYSPAANQTYLLNDEGKSTTTTINAEDARAYGVSNRLHSLDSYSAQQPILKSSIANESQLKRFGESTVLSNIDASFGGLVDFTQQGKKGISYDIETTSTGAKHISNAIQPIEIYAQQIQADSTTGQLLRDADGNLGVMTEEWEEIKNADGTSTKKRIEVVRPQEFHAIMALDNPSKDIISKVSSDPDYFNVGMRAKENLHLVDYLDAITNKPAGMSAKDFLKENFGVDRSKKGASKIVNEMARKSEEFRFLHNVAKYAFGADKNEAAVTAFGKYSNGDAVQTSVGYAQTLKMNDREKYDTFFTKDGQLRGDMTIAFRQASYQNQMDQTANLISDAQTAARNLEDLSFNYGEGVKRLSTADGLKAFVQFQENSDASFIFGQNVEKADNKTLVQSAQNISAELTARRAETIGDGKGYIEQQLDIIRGARQTIFDESLGRITSEYDGKFVVNPMAASNDAPQSGRKTPVSNVADALTHISSSNMFVNDAYLQARDADINVLNSMFDKIKTASGEFTDEEMTVAKQLELFGGNEFAIRNNTTSIAGTQGKLNDMFNGMGVVDQQTIARIVYPQLASQSNASLMDHFKKDASLAHDGKVDTQFVSENIERFSMQVADFYNGNVTEENAALARILGSLDANPTGEGGFMERNSYQGGEFVSFTSSPEKGVQKGVYQLEGISEDGKSATFNRMVQGANGLVVDTSTPTYTMEGLTNAELAHRFAQNVRFLPEGTETEAITAYNDDISRRHFDKILSSNFSYESHMNQIRELEIQSGLGNEVFKNNPLFRIEERATGVNMLEADMEDMIGIADGNGVVNLQSNPLERSRRVYRNSVMKKSDLLEQYGKGAEQTILDPIERSLLLNNSMLDDESKEKFYNKKLSKEQMSSLQDMNDFNHTELGFRLSDLMDNVTALENQGLISVPEKANLLQQWNNELKAKAGKHVYDVKDAAKIPDFMMTVKGAVEGTFEQMPYTNASIQVSSPTEIANSLTSIAKNINKVTEYSGTGLRNDYALNETLVPHLRGLGVVGENDFVNADGKPRFVGLGELSHTIYNNLQANPGLLESHTAVDYLGMAQNISEEDMTSLNQKTEQLLKPFMDRRTEVQKIQFDGLKESKELMRNAGLYIPGMKLIAENYSPDDMETLSKFTDRSYLGNMQTAQLVSMADEVAGLSDDSAKTQTKMIYNEIAKRAATPSGGGTMSINPVDIIADGDKNRLEAARAMNWVRPVKGEEGLHIPVSDMTERRMVGTKFAGSKLGDVPEYMLQSISTHGLRDMQTYDYSQRRKYSPYMQQQEQLLGWRETGFEGHDHRTDTKFNTARGEIPDYAQANREIIEADQARGGARRNPTQFNEQEIGGNVTRDEYIRELAEQGRTQPEAEFPMNNTTASGRTMLNAQPAVSIDDARVRENVLPEMVEPTAERSSGLERYIERTKTEVGDNIKNFLAGESGGKWVAGLGVAAAALFAVNSMNSPLKLENRPDGHGVKGVTGTPEDDREREPIKAPNVQTGATSYVTSGDKGYTIKASGRAPSNIDSSQLQSTINSSMGGASSVNVNLRDDRTTLDNSWLETQFTNFIERGHVGE